MDAFCSLFQFFWGVQEMDWMFFFLLHFFNDLFFFFGGFNLPGFCFWFQLPRVWGFRWLDEVLFLKSNRVASRVIPLFH